MGRTLLMSKTSAVPWDLYELLREVSAFVVVGEQSDHPHSGFDHVVVSDGPNIEVDQRRLLWPADAELVRLFLSR